MNEDMTRPHLRPRLLSNFSRSTTDEGSDQPFGFGGVQNVIRPPPPPFALLPAEVNEDTEPSYSEKVVQFLRQPNIFNVLRERSGESVTFDLRSDVNL